MFVEKKNLPVLLPKSSVGAACFGRRASHRRKHTCRSYGACGGIFPGFSGATNMPLLRSLCGIFHCNCTGRKRFIIYIKVYRKCPRLRFFRNTLNGLKFRYFASGDACGTFYSQEVTIHIPPFRKGGLGGIFLLSGQNPPPTPL